MGLRFNAARRIFPLLLIVLVPAVAAGGQDTGGRGDSPGGAAAAADPRLQEARELSAQGKLQDAAGAYTKWLAENTGNPGFGSILIEAVDSQLSVVRALELLRAYTPRVQDLRQRELCRSSQIDLLEMLGRTEQALGLLRSFPPTPAWLYRQARLLYQQGLAEEAEKSLEQALKALLGDENGEFDDRDGENTELEVRIRLLQARIYTMQDRLKEAENLFRLLDARYRSTAAGPGIILAYYEHLLAEGRTEEAEEQLEKLDREFPDSPERTLAGEEEGGKAVGYAPVPSRLLHSDLLLPQERNGPDQGREQPGSEESSRPPTEAQASQAQSGEPPEKATAGSPPPATVLVQTGSFHDRENAEYMVRDLETGGFKAGIVEKRIGGNLYYRVVIGPAMTVDQAQAVLMRLKDSSFEGVLLFPE